MLNSGEDLTTDDTDNTDVVDDVRSVARCGAREPACETRPARTSGQPPHQIIRLIRVHPCHPWSRRLINTRISSVCIRAANL